MVITSASIAELDGGGVLWCSLGATGGTRTTRPGTWRDLGRIGIFWKLNCDDFSTTHDLTFAGAPLVGPCAGRLTALFSSASL
jgi:hypothetical protein